MAIAITIPRLGWNMDQGVFVGWLRKDGETVRAGDPLFTLEGEKAAQDIEANEPGILRIAPTAPAAGEVVAVGTLIGYLLAAGESEPILDAVSPIEQAVPTGVAAAGPQRRGNGSRSIVAAGRSAAELAAGASAGARAGRRLDAARRQRMPRAGSARWTSSPRPVRDTMPSAWTRAVVPIGATRRTIAARMVRSRQTTAPVTLHTTADATNLVSLRSQYKAARRAARRPATWSSW